MPLYNFTCEKCQHEQEHFVLRRSENKLSCPACSSDRYFRGTSKFKMDVEYTDNDEYMEKKIQPFVDDTYERIGKEAANEDTKTVENLFGKEKVEDTFYQYDD
jgi:putative FmdB family regulatory protein